MKKNFLKSTSFLTALFFSASTLYGAQPVSVSLNPAEYTPVKMEVPEKFSFPRELGTLQEFSRSTESDRFVIYIQDAHSVIDAQKNMEALITYFQRQFHIRLVAVEGTKDDLDPVIFKTFPDEFIKKKILNQYAAKGEISGPELAAIFSPHPAEYFGVEDWGIYEQNYRAYLQASDLQAKVLGRLENLTAEMDAERQGLYSQEFNAYHEEVTLFRNEKLDLFQLLKFLAKIDKNKTLTEERFPHLFPVFKAANSEDPSQGEDMDVVLRKMADHLKKKIEAKSIAKDMMEFNEKYQNFVTAQIDAGSFLKFLVETGRKVGVSPKLSPAMRELLGQTETLSMIKGSKLFEELETVLTGFENSFAGTPEQKELSARYARARIIKDLANLEWTRDQLDEYEKNPAAYLEMLGEGAEDINPALDFYKFAVERDQIFLDRIEQVMDKEKAQGVIVLTGGFHTNGFARRLKNKKYSYATIMPKMNSLQGHENYAPVMKGELSYKRFLKTTLYDAFVKDSTLKMVSEMTEPDFRKNIKVWRDAVIRELSRQGRIEESGKYTKYIDELFSFYAGRYGLNGKFKTREEILKGVDAEVEKLNKETLEDIAEKFQIKSQQFFDGFKSLASDGKLNVEQIKGLYLKVASGQPSAVSNVRPLSPNPTGSIFVAGARSEVRGITAEQLKTLQDLRAEAVAELERVVAENSDPDVGDPQAAFQARNYLTTFRTYPTVNFSNFERVKTTVKRTADFLKTLEARAVRTLPGAISVLAENRSGSGAAIQQLQEWLRSDRSADIAAFGRSMAGQEAALGRALFTAITFAAEQRDAQMFNAAIQVLDTLITRYTDFRAALRNDNSQQGVDAFEVLLNNMGSIPAAGNLLLRMAAAKVLVLQFSANRALLFEISFKDASAERRAAADAILKAINVRSEVRTVEDSDARRLMKLVDLKKAAIASLEKLLRVDEDGVEPPAEVVRQAQTYLTQLKRTPANAANFKAVTKILENASAFLDRLEAQAVVSWNGAISAMTQNTKASNLAVKEVQKWLASDTPESIATFGKTLAGKEKDLGRALLNAVNSAKLAGNTDMLEGAIAAFDTLLTRYPDFKAAFEFDRSTPAVAGLISLVNLMGRNQPARNLALRMARSNLMLDVFEAYKARISEISDFDPSPAAFSAAREILRIVNARSEVRTAVPEEVVERQKFVAEIVSNFMEAQNADRREPVFSIQETDFSQTNDDPSKPGFSDPDRFGVVVDPVAGDGAYNLSRVNRLIYLPEALNSDGIKQPAALVESEDSQTRENRYHIIYANGEMEENIGVSRFEFFQRQPFVERMVANFNKAQAADKTQTRKLFTVETADLVEMSDDPSKPVFDPDRFGVSIDPVLGDGSYPVSRVYQLIYLPKAADPAGVTQPAVLIESKSSETGLSEYHIIFADKGRLEDNLIANIGVEQFNAYQGIQEAGDFEAIARENSEEVLNAVLDILTAAQMKKAINGFITARDLQRSLEANSVISLGGVDFIHTKKLKRNPVTGKLHKDFNSFLAPGLIQDYNIRYSPSLQQLSLTLNGKTYTVNAQGEVVKEVAARSEARAVAASEVDLTKANENLFQLAKELMDAERILSEKIEQSKTLDDTARQDLLNDIQIIGNFLNIFVPEKKRKESSLDDLKELFTFESLAAANKLDSPGIAFEATLNAIREIYDILGEAGLLKDKSLNFVINLMINMSTSSPYRVVLDQNIIEAARTKSESSKLKPPVKQTKKLPVPAKAAVGDELADVNALLLQNFKNLYEMEAQLRVIIRKIDGTDSVKANVKDRLGKAADVISNFILPLIGNAKLKDLNNSTSKQTYSLQGLILDNKKLDVLNPKVTGLIFKTLMDLTDMAREDTLVSFKTEGANPVTFYEFAKRLANDLGNLRSKLPTAVERAREIVEEEREAKKVAKPKVEEPVEETPSGLAQDETLIEARDADLDLLDRLINDAKKDSSIAKLQLENLKKLYLEMKNLDPDYKLPRVNVAKDKSITFAEFLNQFKADKGMLVLLKKKLEVSKEKLQRKKEQQELLEQEEQAEEERRQREAEEQARKEAARVAKAERQMKLAAEKAAAEVEQEGLRYDEGRYSDEDLFGVSGRALARVGAKYAPADTDEQEEALVALAEAELASVGQKVNMKLWWSVATGVTAALAVGVIMLLSTVSAAAVPFIAVAILFSLLTVSFLALWLGSGILIFQLRKGDSPYTFSEWFYNALPGNFSMLIDSAREKTLARFLAGTSSAKADEKTLKEMGARETGQQRVGRAVLKNAKALLDSYEKSIVLMAVKISAPAALVSLGVFAVLASIFGLGTFFSLAIVTSAIVAGIGIVTAARILDGKIGVFNWLYYSYTGQITDNLVRAAVKDGLSSKADVLKQDTEALRKIIVIVSNGIPRFPLLNSKGLANVKDVKRILNESGEDVNVLSLTDAAARSEVRAVSLSSMPVLEKPTLTEANDSLFNYLEALREVAVNLEKSSGAAASMPAYKTIVEFFELFAPYEDIQAGPLRYYEPVSDLKLQALVAKNKEKLFLQMQPKILQALKDIRANSTAYGLVKFNPLVTKLFSMDEKKWNQIFSQLTSAKTHYEATQKRASAPAREAPRRVPRPAPIPVADKLADVRDPLNMELRENLINLFKLREQLREVAKDFKDPASENFNKPFGDALDDLRLTVAGFLTALLGKTSQADLEDYAKARMYTLRGLSKFGNITALTPETYSKLSESVMRLAKLVMNPISPFGFEVESSTSAYNKHRQFLGDIGTYASALSKLGKNPLLFESVERARVEAEAETARLSMVDTPQAALDPTLLEEPEERKAPSRSGDPDLDALTSLLDEYAKGNTEIQWGVLSQMKRIYTDIKKLDPDFVIPVMTSNDGKGRTTTFVKFITANKTNDARLAALNVSLGKVLRKLQQKEAAKKRAAQPKPARVEPEELDAEEVEVEKESLARQAVDKAAKKVEKESAQYEEGRYPDEELYGVSGRKVAAVGAEYYEDQKAGEKESALAKFTEGELKSLGEKMNMGLLWGVLSLVVVAVGGFTFWAILYTTTALTMGGVIVLSLMGISFVGLLIAVGLLIFQFRKGDSPYSFSEWLVSNLPLLGTIEKPNFLGRWFPFVNMLRESAKEKALVRVSEGTVRAGSAQSKLKDLQSREMIQERIGRMLLRNTKAVLDVYDELNTLGLAKLLVPIGLTVAVAGVVISLFVGFTTFLFAASIVGALVMLIGLIITGVVLGNNVNAFHWLFYTYTGKITNSLINSVFDKTEEIVDLFGGPDAALKKVTMIMVDGIPRFPVIGKDGFADPKEVRTILQAATKKKQNIEVLLLTNLAMNLTSRSEVRADAEDKVSDQAPAPQTAALPVQEAVSAPQTAPAQILAPAAADTDSLSLLLYGQNLRNEIYSKAISSTQISNLDLALSALNDLGKLAVFAYSGKASGKAEDVSQFQTESLARVREVVSDLTDADNSIANDVPSLLKIAEKLNSLAGDLMLDNKAPLVNGLKPVLSNLSPQVKSLALFLFAEAIKTYERVELQSPGYLAQDPSLGKARQYAAREEAVRSEVRIAAVPGVTAESLGFEALAPVNDLAAQVISQFSGEADLGQMSEVLNTISADRRETVVAAQKAIRNGIAAYLVKIQGEGLDIATAILSPEFEAEVARLSRIFAEQIFADEQVRAASFGDSLKIKFTEQIQRFVVNSVILGYEIQQAQAAQNIQTDTAANKQFIQADQAALETAYQSLLAKNNGKLVIDGIEMPAILFASGTPDSTTSYVIDSSFAENKEPIKALLDAEHPVALAYTVGTAAEKQALSFSKELTSLTRMLFATLGARNDQPVDLNRLSKYNFAPESRQALVGSRLAVKSAGLQGDLVVQTQESFVPVVGEADFLPLMVKFLATNLVKQLPEVNRDGSKITILDEKHLSMFLNLVQKIMTEYQTSQKTAQAA